MEQFSNAMELLPDRRLIDKPQAEPELHASLFSNNSTVNGAPSSV
jgi:hypothetical protein